MSKIPKIIFQSWKTKNLKGRMKQASDEIQRLNPNYDYRLFDDEDCRKFLLEHFGENFRNAFDAILPGAFKCDFWRYCALYVHGGVYMDMDMEPVVPFDDILQAGDEFVSISDINHMFTPKCNIYQAFMACTPKHPVMYQSMMITFYNITTRRRETFDNLSVTGPVVVGIALNLFWKRKKTHEELPAGNYPDGVRLFRMSKFATWTFDLKGKKIIKNKFDGYTRGPADYTSMKYYEDDPRSKTKKVIKTAFIVVIILAIIGLILFLIFCKKWKTCVKECSASSPSLE